MAYVSLNSIRYLTKGDIQRFKVDPIAPVVRQSGRQRLESLISRQSFVFPAPTYGMGLRRIPTDRIDDPELARRTWDSKADTRFESGVTLPLLRVDSTEPTAPSSTTLEQATVALEHKGEVGLFWSGYASTSTRTAAGRVVVAQYDGASTTWVSAATVLTNTDNTGATANLLVANPLSAISNGNVIFLTIGGNWGSGTNAASRSYTIWTAETLTGSYTERKEFDNYLTNVATAGEVLDAGVLVAIGVDTYAFVWDEVNDEIETWKSTDLGVNWSAVSGATLTDTSGPKGVAAYIDLQGDAAPCFSTADGLFALDTSTSVIQKLVSWPHNSNSGRGLVRWANPVTGVDGLYCGLEDGNILEFVYMGGSGATAKTFAQTIGLNEADGVVADKLGYVNNMLPSSRWLFYTAGGDASGHKAWIGAYDGKGSLPRNKGAGHHYIDQDGTAQRPWGPMIISNRDDGVLRLHWGIRTSSTVTDTQFIAEPLASPDSGVTRSFANPTADSGGADTGYIERPETNMGMPRDQGAFLALFTEARDLSASTSGEFINENYGLEGASPVTDIGDILSGTLELSLASGAGVAFRGIQIREELDRDSGSATQTPLLIATEVMYRKKIDSPNGWQFTVDVAGMEVGEQMPRSQVISDLESAEGNVPLQAFQPLPGGTTYYVDVEIIGWRDLAGLSHGPYEDIALDVTEVTMRLQEVI
jgi:hypothetical protein